MTIAPTGNFPLAFPPPGESLYTEELRRAVEGIQSIKGLQWRVVQDYGATGNGTTDDLNAIQAAATEAKAAGGGKVYFSQGTYLLSASLTIDRSVVLEGEGVRATKIVSFNVAETSGTATSGGNTTITDTGQSWTTNEWVGKRVELVAGTGSEAEDDYNQIRSVVSNTATVITIDKAWSTNPDSTSKYKTYTPVQILVTGSGNWTTLIKDLFFEGIEIVFAPTIDDFGNGSTVEGCEIRNAYAGITTIYNTWMHKILNTEIYNCYRGVWYDFATPATNAGSACRILASDIFNCDHGVYVEEATTDGYDIMITDTNIEHCWLSALKVVDGGDNVIQMVNMHMELNPKYYIDADGANIFIKGLWAFPDGTTHTAVFRLDGSNRTWLSHSRLQWEASKLVELIGGILIIDQNTVFSGNKFFGNGAANMITASSDSGEIRSGGVGHSGAAGSVFTAQEDVAFSALPLSGASVTTSTIRKFEASTRVWEFDLEVATAGTASQILRIDLNPGGTVRMDLVWVNLSVGHGHFRIVWTIGTSITTSGWFIDTTGTNAAEAFHVTATDTHAASVEKTLDVASVATSGTEAVMHIRQFMEYSQ